MEVACVLQSIIMATMKIQRICLINQKSKFCLLVYILQSLQVAVYKLVSLFNGWKNSCFLLELKDATSFDHTSKLNQGHLGDCGKYSTPLKKKWRVFSNHLLLAHTILLALLSGTFRFRKLWFTLAPVVLRVLWCVTTFCNEEFPPGLQPSRHLSLKSPNDPQALH